MLDHLINPDDESRLEQAGAFHWEQLEAYGETSFRSEEEDRIISKDEVMFHVLATIPSENLWNEVLVKPMSFNIKICKLFDAALAAEMNDALEDFYNEL